jgi:hypothetical protein
MLAALHFGISRPLSGGVREADADHSFSPFEFLANETFCRQRDEFIASVEEIIRGGVSIRPPPFGGEGGNFRSEFQALCLGEVRPERMG